MEATLERSPEIEASMVEGWLALALAAAVGRASVARLGAALPASLVPPLRFLLDRRLGTEERRVVATVEAVRAEMAARVGEPIGVFAGAARPLDGVARISSVRPVWGAFLHLCARASGARNVLELGGAVGISGGYLASAPSVARFVTVEGSPERAALARRNLARVAPRAEVITDSFDAALDRLLPALEAPLDLVYYDGTKRRDAVLALAARLAPHLRPGGLLVCDDIRWSREMELTWRDLGRTTGFALVLDAGRMGVAVRGGDGERPRVDRLFAFPGLDLYRLWRQLARSA